MTGGWDRQVGWEVKKQLAIQKLFRVDMSPRSIRHLVPSMVPIVSAAMTLYIAS